MTGWFHTMVSYLLANHIFGIELGLVVLVSIMRLGGVSHQVCEPWNLGEAVFQTKVLSSL